MTKAPNLPSLTGQYLSTTQVNAAFEAIEEAFENTLSLDGSTPNSMQADLDMDSNDILNVNRLEAETVIVDGTDIKDLLDNLPDLMTGTFTEYVSHYDGDGSTSPLALPFTVDTPNRIVLVINGQTYRPEYDYTVSGSSLIPTGDITAWPIGTKNITVRVKRETDLAAITSDDVSYESAPLTVAMDSLLPPNVIRLSDYMEPTDQAAALAGNTAAQDATRVTARIRLWLEAALAATLAQDGANVVAFADAGIYRINDRLMTDSFNNTNWNTSGFSRSRIRFSTNGSVRFRLQNWAGGRAALRTDGPYTGSTYIAPIAVFEWFQSTGHQRFGGFEGQWIIEGANNPETDPIGFYFYRLNATTFNGELEVTNLRNRNFVWDSIFNTHADYVRSSGSAGVMLTEAGGSGLLADDTVSGGVRTGLRYTVSGANLTINTMVYDSTANTYSFTPANVFTADHVGKWIGLDRQGRANLLADDPEEGVTGGSDRRSARWFQISSVTDASTAVLSATPAFQGTTGQMAAQNRTFSFGVLKCDVTAGSNIATLSMPITRNLVGFEVAIPGAHYNPASEGRPNLVAMITAHSGNTVTLSHAVGITHSGVPFVLAPQVHIGSLSHTEFLSTSRKCDDFHIGRLWCESGVTAAVPLFIQEATNVTLGDESKLHGTGSGNKANWGANFACVIGGDVGGRFAGRFTHSRHSREFGMFYLTGDRSELKIDGELSSWTADDQTAIFYIDPANVASTRIWDVYFNASDYATGFPDASAGQVFERGGPNYTPGRVKAGASQRSPRGERAVWPPAALPPSRAPWWGSTRADAVSALARGGVVPENGVTYSIGGLEYLGQTGATALPGLLGLAPLPPYSLDQFGAVGDGVTDDTAAVVAANASGLGPFDLMGRTYATTALSTSLSLSVFNGTLLTRNVDGTPDIYRPRPPITNAEITTTGRKSPVIDWAGRNVLWLGTSIPQEGFVSGDSYPSLVAAALDFTVVNNAWAGSRMRWDGEANIDPLGANNQIRSLSMTQADVAAGLALYGTGTVFDDDYDLVTKASQMTVDARIVNAYKARPFSVVVLDHNHNDRRNSVGTLTPPTYTITGVTIGASTVFSLSSASGITVGSGVTVRITGIAGLDYAFGRVTNVSGTNVTVAYDSTGLAGSFSAGTMTLVDRQTLYGAADFLVSAIRNCNLRYGDGSPVQIIMNGAPSEYTNNTFDVPIWSVNRRLEAYAAARGLAFFDVAAAMDVKAADHLLYFPDSVHPTTLAARQVLARHWVEWMSGGSSPFLSQSSAALLSGTPADQNGIIYNATIRRFVPNGRLRGELVSVLADDFSDGDYSGWTATGETPVVIDAPWSGGGKAVQFPSLSSNVNSYISRNVTTDVGIQCEFDLWLPVVSGLSSGTTKQIPLVQLRSTGGYLSLQATTNESGAALRLVYFKTPNTDNVNGPRAFGLAANTKYQIRLVSFRTTAQGAGFYALFVDGALSSYLETDDIGQSNVANVRLGIINQNTGSNVTAVLGNFDLKRFPQETPLNGNVTIGANTVRFINGLAVSIS